MSIQPTGILPASNSVRSSDTPALQETRSSATRTDSASAVEKSAPVPSQAELKSAIENINKSMQAQSQSLEFSIDQDSERTIVKIVDVTTKEVIRQIPTPEALQIAKSLDTAQGLLLRQTA